MIAPVGAYKLFCEIEGRRLNEANISKYEESTDLLYLDREANGYWDLIHTAEGNELKPLPPRPSQPETPSETPSESIPLPDLRERAIKAYKEFRECTGLER